MMILMIGMISAYDGWLTHIYSKSIISAERNLLSKFIMENTSIETFIASKMFGTLFVCLVLFCLVKTKLRSVIVGVLLFQLWLFYYLNFYPSGIFESFSDTPIYQMMRGELKSN